MLFTSAQTSIDAHDIQGASLYVVSRISETEIDPSLSELREQPRLGDNTVWQLKRETEPKPHLLGSRSTNAKSERIPKTRT